VCARARTWKSEYKNRAAAVRGRGKKSDKSSRLDVAALTPPAAGWRRSINVDLNTDNKKNSQRDRVGAGFYRVHILHRAGVVGSDFRRLTLKRSSSLAAVPAFFFCYFPRTTAYDIKPAISDEFKFESAFVRAACNPGRISARNCTCDASPRNDECLCDTRHTTNIRLVIRSLLRLFSVVINGRNIVSYFTRSLENAKYLKKKKKRAWFIK